MTAQGGCGDDYSINPQNDGPKLNENSHIKHIIAIASGKGGVGKTLTTSLIACELARRGFEVGILDADITGPSIPRSFGVHEPPSIDENNKLLPANTKSGVHIVSTNMLTSDEAQPFLWRGPVLNSILNQFYSDVVWGELDYLLIDMPPGTGDVPMTIYQQFSLDGAIIVTAPQVLVNMIVEKAIRMTEVMKVPVLGLVENMSYFECPDCGGKHEIFGKSEVEKIAANKNIDAWAKGPIVHETAQLVDEGKVDEVDATWLAPVVDKLASLENQAYDKKYGEHHSGV